MAEGEEEPTVLEEFDEPGDIRESFLVSEKARPAIHKVRTRKIRDPEVRLLLSLGLLFIIGVLAIGGGAAWVFLKVDLKELLVILSPITAIAGSVFSFYFAEENKKKKKGKR